MKYYTRNNEYQNTRAIDLDDSSYDSDIDFFDDEDLECVRKFDHHCFWIGGCVGELNHGKFFLFCCDIVSMAPLETKSSKSLVIKAGNDLDFGDHM